MVPYPQFFAKHKRSLESFLAISGIICLYLTLNKFPRCSFKKDIVLFLVHVNNYQHFVAIQLRKSDQNEMVTLLSL